MAFLGLLLEMLEMLLEMVLCILLMLLVAEGEAVLSPAALISAASLCSSSPCRVMSPTCCKGRNKMSR